jgi:predicted MPP superfamily phosphohydrolase
MMGEKRNMISRRRFMQLAGLGAVMASAGSAGLLYASRIEPEMLVVEQVALWLKDLSPVFDGYRIVHISDIHMDHRHMTATRLTGIVSLVNAQQPDFVAITGDFLTRGRASEFVPSLVAPLRELRARDGAGAVLGNHDHWTDARAVYRVIESSGLRNLNNAVHTLERGSAQLHIAGVDDIWENQHRLGRVLDALPRTGVAVLLAHEPDFADESAASGRFALQLSGHSHGGQCVIPGGGMPILPALGRKYPSGLYQVGEMWQYTNRGLGMTWFPQVRFNCRPEITTITLRVGLRA